MLLREICGEKIPKPNNNIMKKNLFYLLSLLLAVWIAMPGMSGSEKETRTGRGSSPTLSQPVMLQGEPLQLYAPSSPFMRTTLPAGITAAPLQADSAKTPILYGIAYGSGGSSASLVSFQAKPNTTFTTIKTGANLDASGGGVFIDGILHLFSLNIQMGQVMGGKYAAWDTFDWTLKRTNDDLWASSCATDLTYDPVTGRVYGQFYQEDMQDLWWGYMDMTTFHVTRLGRLGVHLYAMAATPQGDIYGIDHRGKLLKISKENATYTEIGNTAILPQYMQSATIDPATGKMYWAAMLKDDSSTGLYEVNLQTAQTTLISSFPGNTQINALFIIPAAAEDNAPGYCTDLKLTYTDGSLRGRINYNFPKKTYGGAPLSGFLAAHIEVTDNAGYTASYSDDDIYGASMRSYITVPKAGMYTYTVWASQDNKIGPKSKIAAWIGPDQPLAVGNLTLVNAEGKPSLSWNAPKEGVHGGFFDPAKLTYRVTRLSDSTVVAQELTDTVFVDNNLPAGSISAQTYSVVAIHNGQEGAATVSNAVPFGSALTVPMTIDFGKPADFNRCTVIDANNDSNTWNLHYAGYAEYNSTLTDMAADDWIIAPAVHLEKGKAYDIACLCYLNNGITYEETFEVKAGFGTTVADMTMEVIPNQRATGIRSYYTGKGKFIPAQTGDYCFGFHITSPRGFRFGLHNLTVTEGQSLGTPKAVTNLNAKAADKGALKATLTFTAPSKDISDNALTSLTGIDIYRGDTKIGTIANPTVGAQLTYEADAVQGDNTYKVIAVNASGSSDPATVKVYAGVDRPDVPTDIRLRLSGNEAVLTWKAPTKGANGGYIDTTKLTYTIYSGLYQDIVAENISGNEWRANISNLLEGEQTNFYYGVYAVNAAGGSTGVPSNTVIVGAPFTTPFTEFFPQGLLTNEMWIIDDANGSAGWELTGYEGYPLADGCSLFSSYRTGDQRLSTGKITVKGTNNPRLTFWTKGAKGRKGHLDIEVTTDYTGQWTTLKSIDYNTLDGEWTKVTLSLADYKNSDYIHIGFHGYGTGGTNDLFTCYIDAVEVAEVYPIDMAAVSLAADRNRMEIGETPIALEFTVENKGLQNVSAGWQARLMKNGVVTQSVEGPALAPGAQAKVSLSFNPTFDDPQTLRLEARIDCDGETYTDNNCTDSIRVKVDRPDWPSVTNLQGSQANGKATFTWTKPDMSGKPAARIEDSFETYRPFDIEKAGDWTMHNINGSFTYTITGFYWENTYMDQAWIVWRPKDVKSYEGEPLSAAWQPHTGDQCMACFAEDDGANDDWLVSPQLTGVAQQISFFARSTIVEYGLEKFEILYSTTDTRPESFTKLDEATVPDAWTEYKYNLPAGAKYFAIRCVSRDRFCLLVDDVTFDRAAKPLNVTFSGFNVYRGNELLNAAPVAEPHFTAPHKEQADYSVKVVYDKGESARSNIVTLEHSGVSSVIPGMKADQLYDTKGLPVYAPEKGHIYILDGKRILWNK